MRHFYKYFLTIILTCTAAPPVYADTIFANLPNIQNVLVGTSSTGSDQVWFRVIGQPVGVPNDCVSGGSSLFYIPNDGGISADHAESLLLSAKMANQPVSIVFEVDATLADLWTFGATKCIVRRMSLGS